MEKMFMVKAFIDYNETTKLYHIAGKVYFEDDRPTELWPLGTTITPEKATQVANAWAMGRRAELQLQARGEANEAA